jgi:hypothetical protein
VNTTGKCASIASGWWWDAGRAHRYPPSRRFAGADVPERLQDMAVDEVARVPFEVIGQAWVIREPTMKPNPASSRAFRLAAKSIPTSATTNSGTPCGI